VPDRSQVEPRSGSKGTSWGRGERGEGSLGVWELGVGELASRSLEFGVFGGEFSGGVWNGTKRVKLGQGHAVFDASADVDDSRLG